MKILLQAAIHILQRRRKQVERLPSCGLIRQHWPNATHSGREGADQEVISCTLADDERKRFINEPFRHLPASFAGDGRLQANEA